MTHYVTRHEEMERFATCWHRRLFYGALFLAIVALTVALGAIAANADDGHAKWHHVYKGWTNGKGDSCCNNNDCRPARTRWTPTKGWQVWVVKKWCSVPHAKVRPYTHPDRGSHVCALTKAEYDYYNAYSPTDPCEHIYCFVRGETRG